MRLLLLFTFTLVGVSVFSQHSGLFQNAYNQNASVPRGILEAVSWSNTRMHHLTGQELESCSGMPRAFGIMGLFKDGKEYFRENAYLVEELSGISVAQQSADPGKQILAYASAFNTLFSGYISQQLSEDQAVYLTLHRLSEIPDSGRVNQYASDAQVFQIMRFMNDEEFASTHQFPVKHYDLKNVFGPANLKVLSADKIILSEQSIRNEAGDNFSISVLKSTEYGPAIWNPAPSCNYSSRSGVAISAITIHTIQGSYAGAISWSQNCASNVSFHYVLRSSDGQVTQMVLEANKAWHVGSENSYTIGYEHEGWVDQTGWYTEAMYQSSAALTRDIVGSGYGIPPLRTFYGNATSGINVLGNCTKIKGHQHYPNQSHTDPGINWNWEKYYKLINQNPTITTVTSASGSLYDSGGPTGNYGNDERRLWLIQPASAATVTAQFTQFNIENNWDFMFIYDGATTNAPLIGKYTGTNSPGTITSTGGSLLIEFRSDCATVAAGWQINYTSASSSTTLPETTILPGTQWKTSDFDVQINDVSTQSAISERYYLVADRPGASSEWKAANGFVLDDFTTLGSWVQNTGTFSISNGRLKNSDESLSNTNLYLNFPQSGTSDYLYTWTQRFTGTGASQRAGFHFMCSNATLPNRGASYFVFLRESNNKVQIYSVTNDVYTLHTDDDFTINTNIDYEVKVSHSPSTGWIRVYINNVLASSWQHTTPLQSGNSISFRTANTKVEFDNLRIYKSRSTTVHVTTGAGGQMRYESLNAQPTGRMLALAKDAQNWSSVAVADFLLDWSGPVKHLLNDGADADLTHFQGESISGNWSFSDSHSGINQYEYAVGTTPGNDDIIAWSDATESTSFTESFTHGVIGQTYYTSVRATNGAGLTLLASSTGQIYSPESLSLENNLLDQVIVFPNPFTEQISVHHLPGKSTITLYDINGKVVYSGETHSTNERIDAGNLAPGVYQLMIVHNQYSAFRKIIKH